MPTNTARPILIFLFLLCCGAVGWLKSLHPEIAHIDFSAHFAWPPVLDAFYRSLQLFVANYDPPSGEFHPYWILNLMRFVAPGVTVFAIVAAFFQSVRIRLKAFCYSLIRETSLVIGYGAIGQGLARALRTINKNTRVVAIDRHTTPSDRDEAQFAGVELYEADAREPKSFNAAPIHWWSVKKVYIAVGADSQTIATTAKLANGKFSTSAEFWMHLRDRDLLDRLRHSSILGQKVDRRRIKSFSLGEAIGEELVAVHRPMLMARAMGQNRLHVVIIGFDELAWNLVETLCMMGWFPPPALARPRFTILDPNANKAALRWFARHPDLWRWADFNFIEADIGSISWSAEDGTLDRVEIYDPPSLYIFGRSERDEGLPAALALRQGMEKGLRQGAPIFVTSQIAGIEQLGLREIRANLSDRIRFIGDAADAASYSHSVNPWLERIARAFHAGFEKVAGADEFDTLPETMQASNRRAALHSIQILALLGFEQVDVRKSVIGLSEQSISRLRRILPSVQDQLAGLEHLRWCIDRTIDGWREGARDDEARYRSQIGIGPHHYRELDSIERKKDTDQLYALTEMLTRDCQQFPEHVNSPIRIVEVEGPTPRWIRRDGILELEFEAEPDWSQHKWEAGEFVRLRISIPPEPPLEKHETPYERSKKMRRPAYAHFATRLEASAPTNFLFRLVRTRREGWNWLGEVTSNRMDGVTLPPLTVGFAGHRDLSRFGEINTVTKRLQSTLLKELECLRASGRDMRLVTGVAEGSDEVMLKLWSERDFGPILGLYPDQEAREKCALTHLVTVSEVAQSGLVGDVRYLDIARRIADSCDILVAIFNGEKANGVGGTADCVSLAKMSGKGIRIISPHGHHEHKGTKDITTFKG